MRSALPLKAIRISWVASVGVFPLEYWTCGRCIILGNLKWEQMRLIRSDYSAGKEEARRENAIPSEYITNLVKVFRVDSFFYLPGYVAIYFPFVHGARTGYLLQAESVIRGRGPAGKYRPFFVFYFLFFCRYLGGFSLL